MRFMRSLTWTQRSPPNTVPHKNSLSKAIFTEGKSSLEVCLITISSRSRKVSNRWVRVNKQNFFCQENERISLNYSGSYSMKTLITDINWSFSFHWALPLIICSSPIAALSDCGLQYLLYIYCQYYIALFYYMLFCVCNICIKYLLLIVGLNKY
jgi:hypothetical protein